MDATLVVGVVVAVGGRWGGGREAHEIPGRGEEDEYRGGRKVQGGLDELSAGRRKRRAVAVASGPGTGSQGRGASSGAAGDGNGRGLDGCTADAPPVALRRGRSLLPPLVDCHVPVDGDGSDVGD